MTDVHDERQDKPRTIAELVEQQRIIEAENSMEARVRAQQLGAGPPKQINALADEAHFHAVSTAKGVLLTIFIPHTDLFSTNAEPEPERKHDRLGPPPTIG